MCGIITGGRTHEKLADFIAVPLTGECENEKPGVASHIGIASDLGHETGGHENRHAVDPSLGARLPHPCGRRSVFVSPDSMPWLSLPVLMVNGTAMSINKDFHRKLNHGPNKIF